MRALRYYEEKGALRPERTPSGYRSFSDSDVSTVAHIQTLLTAGLGLELIAQILTCMSGEQLLLSDCRARLEVERERMSRDIDRLTRTREMLDGLLAPAADERP